MPNLLKSWLARYNETSAISFTDWAKLWSGNSVTFNGRPHASIPLGAFGPGAGAYRGNSVVFACESKRAAVFSEARFAFQRLRSGTPGDFFVDGSLRLLEQPWPGATLRDLLVACELDIMSAGNSYWVLDENDEFLIWLDPACITIVTSAHVDPISGQKTGEQLLGYVYRLQGGTPTYYAPHEIAHYKPIPSGSSRFLGGSWLSPCLPDVNADELITQHKVVSLDSGAKLGVVVSIDKDVQPDDFDAFVQLFNEKHEGAANSGKTLFLGGGADVKTVGQTFDQLNLKAVQGGGETRIAACSGVPAVVAQISEGLAGSSLNAGNYGAAKRAFADITIRPLWGAWAGAFQYLLNTPRDARLWYDDRDVAFLREDVTDQAEILAKNALTTRTLLDAGFEPDAVVEAVDSGDIKRLSGSHSGLFSVQLQPPVDPNAAPSEGVPA